VVGLLVDQHRLFVVMIDGRGRLAAFQEQNALAGPSAGIRQRRAARAAAYHDHVGIVRHPYLKPSRARLHGSRIRTLHEK
jgi:hypothetical protein